MAVEMSSLVYDVPAQSVPPGRLLCACVCKATSDAIRAKEMDVFMANELCARGGFGLVAFKCITKTALLMYFLKKGTPMGLSYSHVWIRHTAAAN